jgi:multidrug resistance efflux pump
LSNREEIWDQDTPTVFELPGWYFDPSEQLQAAKAELAVAREDYANEMENFQELLNDPGNAELQEAEARLAEAQTAFLVAQTLRDRDIGQEGREQVDDFIQTLFDSAESELESAQLEYDQLLTDQEYEDVLEARARVSVAKQRYEIALDHQSSLQTGENDLSIKASEAGLAQSDAALIQAQAALVQADAGITQAEKAVAQTQASLEMAQIQLDKLTVHAPVAGVVMTQSIEVGELAQAGSSALTIGQLDDLTVKVYIPENQYGQIDLGDIANLTTNSFPDEIFEATVIRIANKAEYTPRNVQTSEDRATTVYAIELSLSDPDSKLKPGMQVDVSFK